MSRRRGCYFLKQRTGFQRRAVHTWKRLMQQTGNLDCLHTFPYKSKSVSHNSFECTQDKHSIMLVQNNWPVFMNMLLWYLPLLYKTGIWSVDNLFLLFTPISSGLPLLQQMNKSQMHLLFKSNQLLSWLLETQVQTNLSKTLFITTQFWLQHTLKMKKNM